jgi:enoyl-CoA hydratase/carnithine racemase
MTSETTHYETLDYAKNGRIATITFNQPQRYNTIRPPMPDDLEKALAQAHSDRGVHVIVLQGEGEAFCAGFDFSNDLEHFSEWGMDMSPDNWDPGYDMIMATNPFTAPVPKFNSIWRSPKPVIAKVHGWCVGGGSEMALLADFVIASEDAQFGTPYSRVWGCHLTGMWIYRLGLTKAKQYGLTGDSVSGREAADIGLINEACVLEDLDERTNFWAERMAQIPVTQLAAMKLIVNQAYDNMGLQSTQNLGPILDGMMRNTPEGKDFVRTSLKDGVGAAIIERDGPFSDYSQGSAEMKPRRNSEVKRK